MSRKILGYKIFLNTLEFQEWQKEDLREIQGVFPALNSISVEDNNIVGAGTRDGWGVLVLYWIDSEAS